MERCAGCNNFAPSPLCFQCEKVADNLRGLEPDTYDTDFGYAMGLRRMWDGMQPLLEWVYDTTEHDVGFYREGGQSTRLFQTVCEFMEALRNSGEETEPWAFDTADFVPSIRVMQFFLEHGEDCDRWDVKERSITNISTGEERAAWEELAAPILHTLTVRGALEDES